MKRTTVSLPDDVANLLEFESRRRCVSISEVDRRALIAHLKLSSGQPRTVPFMGIGDSGRDDI
jgi:hypothetical protein